MSEMAFVDFLAECATAAHAAGRPTQARTLDRARCEILGLRAEVDRLQAECVELRRQLDHWYSQAVGL